MIDAGACRGRPGALSGADAEIGGVAGWRSEGALRSLYDYISAAISAGEDMGVRNFALTVSSELYAQYQQAYITGYSLTIVVLALLCLLAALVIFRGIRRDLNISARSFTAE